jgi:K+-sensing histidine kinase KdpD
VIEKIVGVLEQAHFGTIMLWDKSSGLFRSAASFGFLKEYINQLGLRAGESITGKVFDEGRAVLLSTPEEVKKFTADMREANRRLFSLATGTDKFPIGVIAAPLATSNEKYGCLVLETLQGPAEFLPDDLPFLQTIADLVALAIDRDRLEARADEIKQAQAEERMRSEVMATLSHQLRLPLSTIKGYSSALLLDDIRWPPEKQVEFLKLIESECDNMQSMVYELLDSSLIDIGQMSLELQPVQLERFVLEITGEFRRRFENHRIIVDFPDDFPLLEADPRWIKQVFRNIIDNSIKYSPEGGLVVIQGEVRSKDVVVSIADQGVGISPEELIPLFEKYYRGKATHGLHVAGTGLGLPIARTIIEAHGGRIWAESKLGQGTTIFFSLPRPKPAAFGGAND